MSKQFEKGEAPEDKVRIQTPKGMKSPQEAIALIADESFKDGDARGLLKALESQASDLLPEAAQKILGSYHFDAKTKKLARELLYPQKEKTFGDKISENADRFKGI